MKKTKIIATIEARVGSSRLPNKVLKKIGKKSILEIIIDRLKKSKLIDQIVIATTKNVEDDRICYLAKSKKISYYRGSEFDVLDRISNAISNYKGDLIVQLTGDNPLIDYSLIDKMLKYFKNNKIDFLTNNGFGDENLRTYPIGTDIKIFKGKDILKINNLKLNKTYREHPSLFFYKNKKFKYKIKNINIPFILKRDYKLRITVDTLEDFKLVKLLYLELSKKNAYFSLKHIIEYVDNNLKLLQINSNIRQKKVPLKLNY